MCRGTRHRQLTARPGIRCADREGVDTVELPTVGTGDHVWEVHRPFGPSLAGPEPDNISHVAVDSRDRVYLYRRGDPPVVVTDADGAVIDTWGSGLLLDAHGIYISPDDTVFLVDRDAHEVLAFDDRGNVKLRLGNRGRPALQAPFNHPADVAVAPDTGEIYVADGYGNSAVHRFSADGRHLGSWGEAGGGPGMFTTPHGVWVDLRGRVVVADRENHRIQLFTASGEYLEERRDLYEPMDVFEDRDGFLYVTDHTPRMTVYDADGRLVTRARTPDISHGVWGDSAGNIYLACNEQPVTKLARA